MITNNKKYRIKWRHINNATNNQNNKKRPVSYTECYIYDLESNILLKIGKTESSQDDKNYCKAAGRYLSTKRAMAGMEPADQVDILESLELLPSHCKLRRHNYKSIEEWANQHLSSISQQELNKSFKDMVMFGREKWTLDSEGNWKRIDLTTETE